MEDLSNRIGEIQALARRLAELKASLLKDLRHSIEELSNLAGKTGEHGQDQVLRLCNQISVILPVLVDPVTNWPSPSQGTGSPTSSGGTTGTSSSATTSTTLQCPQGHSVIVSIT